MVIFVIEKELDGVKLRVYSNGKIESFYKNRWHDLNGCINNQIGYYTVRINNKLYYKHRIIGWSFLDLDIDNSKIQIDHIDRNRANNKLSNLRVVTHQQNNFNRKNVKGYYWNKQHNKWKARIMLDGKDKHLGYFDKEDEARTAYLEAKVKYHII